MNTFPYTHSKLSEPDGEHGRLRLVDSPIVDRTDIALRPARITRRHVLVVGAVARQRRELRAELAQYLSPSTRFREASAAWEVLQQAPTSRMVVLIGDLEDISAGSLSRVLARRHPSLPVLTIDPTLQPAPGEDASPDEARVVTSLQR